MFVEMIQPNPSKLTIYSGVAALIAGGASIAYRNFVSAYVVPDALGVTALLAGVACIILLYLEHVRSYRRSLLEAPRSKELAYALRLCTWTGVGLIFLSAIWLVMSLIVVGPHNSRDLITIWVWLAIFALGMALLSISLVFRWARMFRG